MNFKGINKPIDLSILKVSVVSCLFGVINFPWKPCRQDKISSTRSHSFGGILSEIK